MKKALCRVGTTAAVLIWMIVIFLFSNQPAAESSQISSSFSYRLVSRMDEIFQLDLKDVQIEKDAMRIEYPVRKAAHMAEYAIMGLLCFAFFYSWGIFEKRRYQSSFFATVCYAASDEIHQLFVPGRSGMITDVGVDAVGTLLGLLFLMLILKIVRKHCTKEKLPIQ